MAYNVYTPQYHGSPHNHVALFVRRSTSAPEASGKCFHVIGTILTGMHFEIRDRESPPEAPDYVPETMLLVGTVKEGDEARLEEICRAVPPPEPQRKQNGKAKDPGKPLRRYGEWVQEVFETLKAEGVVHEDGDGAGGLESMIKGEV